MFFLTYVPMMKTKLFSQYYVFLVKVNWYVFAKCNQQCIFQDFSIMIENMLYNKVIKTFECICILASIGLVKCLVPWGFFSNSFLRWTNFVEHKYLHKFKVLQATFEGKNIPEGFLLSNFFPSMKSVHDVLVNYQI